MCPSKRSIGCRVIGIDLDGMLELLDAPCRAFFISQIPGLLPLQICIVCKGIHAWRIGEALLGLSRELEPNLHRDCASQFTLDFQNVADVAVVAVSPDVCLVACLNQPGSHANALPLSAHATFQQ